LHNFVGSGVGFLDVFSIYVCGTALPPSRSALDIEVSKYLRALLVFIPRMRGGFL
jgi:hypothetical protein